ncbi:MAG: methyltransferase domain-containing protein [Synergistales bacterium]|nr:methyltransferase domain-containing protein [Synergistales bacterium]
MIFISGIPLAGKTTLASKLGAYLDWPVFTTDHVYYHIARHLGLTEEVQICEFGNPRVWQQTPNIDQLKRRFYPKFLADIPQEAIIEGYGLCFSQDRAAIGIEPEAHFYLEVSYEEWLAHRGYEHTLERREEYDYLTGLVNLPNQVYRIDTKTNLCVPDEKVYTGLPADFVPRKFAALKLGDLTGKTVLDLGGNDGTIARLCLEKEARNALVVDSNWRHLQRAVGVDKRLFDLNRIDELEGQFDIVLSISMLHYIRDQEGFIRECARLTGEQFVLELPVLEEKGLRAGWDNPPGTIKPTQELVTKWLKTYFGRVELVGPSVSPDKSKRLVFKAYPG